MSPRSLVLGLLLPLLATLPPTPAGALTPAEIDAAALHARQGLRSNVKRLAGTRLGGRDNGTPESDLTQHLLIKRLRRLGEGLNTGARGDDAYKQPFVQNGRIGTNLLAVIRGSELPDEYVIVGGHYDHLGTRSNAAGDCSNSRVPGGAICPGATDNAAGVAAVLSIGRAIRRLPTPPRRSVVLALWDAEEDSLAGSLYYVRNPLVPLAATTAYVNFDLLGANLLPTLRRSSFAVGPKTGGSALGAFIANAVATEGLGTVPVSYIFGQLRSDYANFVQEGRVPTVFFGDSTGGCYHSTGDTYRIVDFEKLAAQTRIGFRTTMALTETATPPPFREPNPALAVYGDAVSVHQVFSLAQADIPLFPPADQMVLRQIEQDLAAVVQGGPGAFDGTDVATVLNAALQGIGALTRLPCQKF